MKELSLLNRIVRDVLLLLGLIRFKIKIVPDNPAPENLKSNVVYVVGGKDFVKWAYLKCPSHCGDTIMLSLNTSQSPSWSVKQDKVGRLTIYPSIHKEDGCKSHFWLRNGNVKWAT